MMPEVRRWLVATLPPLRPIHFTVFSIAVVGMLMIYLVVLSVGFRTETIGLLGIGAVFGLAVVIAIILRPELGAYLLIVSIFTNISSVVDVLGGPSINKPLVAVVFVSVLFNRLFLNKEKIELRAPELAVVGYALAVTVSMLFAKDRNVALDDAIDVLKEFVIVISLIFSLRTTQQWERATWLLILSAMFLTTLSAYQIFTGNYEQTFFGLADWRQDFVDGEEGIIRIAGPGLDTNFYAQSLLAVLPLALYRVLEDTNWTARVIAFGAAGLLLFAIMNTYSRGAFLTMGLMLIAMAIERKVRFQYIALFAVMGMLALPFMPASYLERMGSLVGIVDNDNEGAAHEDDSFKGRTSEMLSGLMMFQEHPLVGIGAGNYEYVYHDYARLLGLESRAEARQAHSLYIEIAAETGLLGIVSFGSIFMLLLSQTITYIRELRARNLLPQYQKWMASLGLGLLCYLTTSIFLHGDFIRYLWQLVALGAAAVHIASDAIRAYDAEQALQAESLQAGEATPMQPSAAGSA